MKNEDIKSVYRSLLFYIHHAVPGRLLTETALSLSKSCLGYFTSVIIIRKIIILVENGFIQFTYPLLVCFLSINILFSCVNLYYNHIVKPQKQVILQKAFYHMIVERTATISLAETEKDVFHTQADLIFKTLNKRVESVIANLNRISGAILSIVMAGITLIYIDYRFLAMGFLSILSLYFAKKYGKAISNRESQLASSTKAKKYYQELWLNKEFAMQTSSTFLHCKVKSFLHSTVSSFLHCTVSRFLHCMVSSFLHCLVMSSLHPCQVAGEAGRYLSAENIRVLEPVGFSLE